MFESGMEELTLLFVQRKGFGDSLDERHELRSTDKKRGLPADVNEDPPNRGTLVGEISGLQLNYIFSCPVLIQTFYF